MKLFALTVGRNEADRYLESMLAATKDVVDEHFYYDDQSTDESLELAKAAGCSCAVRDTGPSFLEHEGLFRQNAWSYFQDTCLPEPGDWVLAIDADEALVGAGESVRADVDRAIGAAETQHAKSVLLPVPEVFRVDNGTPWVRVDGYWGTIAGTRLFRYEPGGVYRDKPMGCGAEPTYVASSPISRVAEGLHLMHYGYADPADQVLKHQRYTSLANHGHADAHVQSIIQPPTLRRWDGPVPDMRKRSWTKQ